MGKVKTYRMFIDRKVTAWQRLFYDVEATSKKEAVKLLADEAERDYLPDTGTVRFRDSEFLLDTAEMMTEEENQGNPVVEAFFDDDPDFKNVLERKSK